jgi:hypothetical protein
MIRKFNENVNDSRIDDAEQKNEALINEPPEMFQFFMASRQGNFSRNSYRWKS